ncbi:unnamed protein product, partial [Effrenium voratum]
MAMAAGVMDFTLDGGDATGVESAAGKALAGWFGAAVPHVRSEATFSAGSGRRLQQLQWSVYWEVFVYLQQSAAADAAIQDLQQNVASVERFAADLQSALGLVGLAGFAGFGFSALYAPVEVSMTHHSSSTTSSTTTSMTETSTTTSSSTSTTTSLFPLLLESAELMQGYSTIMLTFNERAILTETAIRRLQGDGADAPSDTVDCAAVFTSSTLS